ncbi:MAG: glycoside hydrolase family 28 protein [Marinilabiliaceae bacterium]|nr:glycoside hydrolase family 28 protein [Marinilabiliaceae bacterium]
MKKLLISMALIIGGALSATAQPQGWINVTKEGAKNDGKTLTTAVIQKCIDRAAQQGGGVVYFPAGDYLTGAIKLKSNITLHIDGGATLMFSDNPDHYLPFVKVRWEGVMMNSFCPLIYADSVENVTIEGRGVLDGQGKKWWNTTLANIAEIKKNGDLTNLNHYQKMWMEANPNIEVSDYYKNTLKRRFFRPPFFQLHHSKNIRIAGVKFTNSPFWTINPEFCDNLTIDGVTVINPDSPNTDGINPESCSNVHICNCHISVGDDCITIKSGRDADGRRLAAPCENITITNCTMLSGHGGVVIGSEMSGSVRKITISNCVFDGTDRGIRLKASRERGGVVEEIRVDNIVMKNIQRQAFIFDLFYDKSLPEGPVTEKTPSFRNIHISNVTATEVKQAGMILGIPEMPIQNLTFHNINIEAETGFDITTAKNIEFHNVTIDTQKGAAFNVKASADVVMSNIKSNRPLANTPVVRFEDVKNTLVSNCFPLYATDTFAEVKGASEKIYFNNNAFHNVTTPVVNQSGEGAVMMK